MFVGLGRISVLTDIRPPDSAFSSFNGYPISVVFFDGYPYGYPFSDFTTIRPDIRRIVRFLSMFNCLLPSSLVPDDVAPLVQVFLST